MLAPAWLCGAKGTSAAVLYVQAPHVLRDPMSQLLRHTWLALGESATRLGLPPRTCPVWWHVAFATLPHRVAALAAVHPRGTSSAVMTCSVAASFGGVHTESWLPHLVGCAQICGGPY
eukprot:363437-Chlamydomonas_euryale.AAC.14